MYYFLSSLVVIFCLTGCGSDSDNTTKEINEPDRAVTEVDTTPERFEFLSSTGHSLNIKVVSEPVTIFGIEEPVAISIIDGEYSIDGGPFTSSTGSIDEGERVVVRLITASTPEAEVTATLNVGGVSSEFSVITEEIDLTPDLFVFSSVENVSLNELTNSEVVTITGLNVPTPISIVDGTYSIDGGDFVNAPSVIMSGQTLELQLTSSVLSNNEEIATITIGSYPVDFSVTTLTDDQAPVVTITFPFGNSMVTDDLITVRGKAVDESNIESILINGIRAVSLNDFGDWAATIPLVNGLNTITYKTADIAGNEAEMKTEISVDSQSLMGGPKSLALDIENNRVIVSDTVRDSLYFINLENGVRTLLTGDTRGEGPEIVSPLSIALDVVKNRVLVVDPRQEVLIGVDLVTGNRSIVSGNNTGSGVMWSFPIDVALDEKNNRAIVGDSTTQAIYSVDLLNGNRELISNEGRGSGPTFNSPSSIKIDHESNTAYIADQANKSIYAIELSSGNRTLISNDSHGVGQDFVAIDSIELDLVNNRMFVTDNGSLYFPTREFKSVIEVSIETGNRTVISGLGMGNGQKLELPVGISLDLANNRALIADYGTQSLSWVDLESGNRSILSSKQSGYAKNWKQPLSIAKNERDLYISDLRDRKVYQLNLDTNESIISFDDSAEDMGVEIGFSDISFDSVKNSLFLYGGFEFNIVEVPISTKTPKVIADNESGSELRFGLTKSIRHNNETHRTYYIDETHRHIAELKVETGDREVIINSFSDIGVEVSDPAAFALDINKNRMLVADSREKSVYSIDLESGSGTLVSSSYYGLGRGDELVSPEVARFDFENNRLIILDNIIDEFIGVSLENGDRETLISNEIGRGPELSSLRDFVLDIPSNRIFLVDGFYNGVFVVDLISGDRALIFP